MGFVRTLGGSRDTLCHAPRKRHPGSSKLLLALVALMVGAASLTASPASAKGPRPVVSNFAASSETVPSGGTITVTGSVSGATECTLSSNKPVEGLPVTFPCESGTVDRKVTMPTNREHRSVTDKLTLKARSAGGKSGKAKLRVTVESETFTVEMLQRLEGETTYTHQLLIGKAPLTVEYEIVVSNIGEEAPVHVDSIGDMNVPGCQTLSPKQREVKLGEREVIEAACSHTLGAQNESFTNEAEVRGTFSPHHQPCIFEVLRSDTVETEIT
jgi:hypothetical protein